MEANKEEGLYLFVKILDGVKSLLALIIFGLFGSLLIATARHTSLAYDEVIYAPAGVMYWKTGDFRWNSEHPPLQKLISSRPLLAEKITVPTDLDPVRTDAWRMGYRLFFQNHIAAPVLVFAARLPTIVLTLCLGCLLFVWMKIKTGIDAALVSLTALAMDPLVLSNGSLAMNDIFVTFFVFSAVLAFQRWFKKPSLLWALGTGALAGAAVASKFSGLLLVPIIIFLSRRKFNVIGLCEMMFAGSVVLLLCYGFRADLLIQAIRAGASFHEIAGRTGYLLGPIPGASGWFYYPIAFLIKTPIPLLILGLASVIFIVKKADAAEKEILFVPIVLFWLAALASRNHFGFRYLLPATPFVAAAIGIFFASLRSTTQRLVCVSLLVWLGIETIATYPHSMAYFNELIGGSKNGYKWLDGSNQDWGQDLPALKALVDKQQPKPSLCFGYWGSNEPEGWGINYQDVLSPAITNSFRSETINPVNTPREWLVVSAELLHNPSTKDAYAWLKDRKPIACPGSTLFVYDITTDKESILKLAAIYKEMGREQLFARQMARTYSIQ